jgi:CHAT domain-containing protein/Tfp pilus assembly protein PilF
VPHAAADEPCPCVVVDEVTEGSTADPAGLLAGDRLLGWAPPATGSVEIQEPLCSPFRLAQLPIDLGQRATLVLFGRRGEDPWRRTVAASTVPGLRLRSCAVPTADDDAAAWDRLQSAQASSRDRAWTEADAAFEEALRRLEHADPSFRAQVLRAWGDTFTTRNDSVEAERRYQQALELDQRGAIGLAVALDHQLLGVSARERGDPDTGEPHLREALKIRQQRAAGSLEEASTLAELGALEQSRGRMDASEALLRQALELQTRIAPDSLDTARTLYLLGFAVLNNDLPQAEAHLRRSLALCERLAPRSLHMSDSVNGVGVVTGIKGDIHGAADYFRRALALREALRPGDPRIDLYLSNLGKASEIEGDLVQAEDYYRRALAGAERQNPHSPRSALLRLNVGLLALAQGDLEAAEAELRRALAISERLGPRGTDTRSALSSLAFVALARGDAAAARDLLKPALDIDAEQSPDGISMANDLTAMSRAKRLLGDLAGAEAAAQHALRIREVQSPHSTDMAEVLHALAAAAIDRGEPARAAELYGRALTFYRRMAPGSASEAETHHALGLAYTKMDKGDLALDSFCSALDSLESQGARLGGTDSSHVSFRARYSGYYHDCLVALVSAGRAPEAVQVLERARARSLLALLAEREVVFAADVPPALATERRLANVDYERAQAAVSRLSAKTGEAEVAKLLERQREARTRQEEVASRIRKASPRFASLQYPTPLDRAAVRAALDPGTLLLSYSVGENETVLLALAPTADPGVGLWVERLPVGERALRGKIEALRHAIQDPAVTPPVALVAQAADLYRLLIGPVEAQVAASERVLLMPDGPLHSLPFAALVRQPPGARSSFFVEWKPLHIVPSATVYAELRKSRRDTGAAADARLVAFGDPRYPPAAGGRIAVVANPVLRDVTRSFALTPLPLTRREVDGVARFFPSRAEKYFGLEATEERAKALDRSARYVHFACHGYLDPRFPLNSALALTIPAAPADGQDNGLLQAWEIFDQMRIDADLVVLSACDTALGKETGGEGLLGLTRAFLYAGARSVLGTLWGISDTASPLLMERFYRHLRSGKSRDAALQAAQVDFIRGRVAVPGLTPSAVAHPFRWAAFQLSGDIQ